MAPAPLTLLESADLLGRYRFVELAGFSLLGARAKQAKAPRLAAWCSGASLAHGSRARAFEERLPVSVGLPGPAELTRSPGKALDGALRLLARAGEEELLGALLQVLYPAMLDAWAEREAAASPAADPPLLRCLQRARADLSAVLAAGEALAASLALAPGPGEPSASLPATLRKILQGNGGPFGALRDGA